MLGIGGCTLAQARQNLSAEEVALWQAYRAKRGTLSLGLRLEQLFAISDARAAQMAGAKKVDVAELLRHHDADEQDPDTLPEAQSLEQIATLLGWVGNQGK